jgi:class 3 adenylate cyclase
MPPVRRLTAILAADVAGYSRLMGADEEGTHERVQAHLRELVNLKIAEHRGRIVKNTGDGFLAEFASVVDAVRCAVEMQRAMAERNASTPPEKRIEFRIGINLGDVIAEDYDIFGDGVNVAARLEALAAAGGTVSAGWSAIRCATGWITHSRTWGSKRLRTSPGQYACTGFGTMPHPSSSECQPRPRHCRCPTSRRLQCCPSPI